MKVLFIDTVTKFKPSTMIIIPLENDTYSIIIYKIHNRVQSTVIHEVNNIKANELCSTFNKLRENKNMDIPTPWNSNVVRNKY